MKYQFECANEIISCGDCPCRFYDIEEYSYCLATDPTEGNAKQTSYSNMVHSKPDWCPLVVVKSWKENT